MVAGIILQALVTGASHQFSRRLAIQLTEFFPKDDWCMCMELLGVEGIGSLLYVDDVAATFPSKQAVSNAARAALPMYERMARAKFNLGPQRTAVMCCYGADPPDIQNMQCSVRKVLGCFIDEHLTLNNQEAFVLNVGKALFVELLNMSNECGFPPPVVAVAVAQRVEPVILYGCELFARGLGKANFRNFWSI